MRMRMRFGEGTWRHDRWIESMRFEYKRPVVVWSFSSFWLIIIIITITITIITIHL
jgi:hypothetical protein